DLTLSEPPAGRGGAIWISPTFTAVGLESTGACATLGRFGERLFGAWDGERCDVSSNPSFLVEMRF
ncbi:MAG: hypothetical protein ACTSXZ_05715, partial [Alphaproteobacteria bacterium]